MMKSDEYFPPLPPTWTLLEELDEDVLLGSLPTRIRIVGFEALGPESLRATGSAASSAADAIEPRRRAWFELLERAATAEFHLAHAPQVLPDGLLPSRSNGVALGMDERSAKLRAWMERLERHLILSHWKDKIPPVRLSERWFAQCGLTPQLRERHEFCAILFPTRSVPQVYVTGIVGFPRCIDGILLAGWGTSTRSLSAALRKAAREVLQSAGFLNEMTSRDFLISSIDAAGPEAHLNHFQSPEGQREMRAWVFSRDRAHASSSFRSVDAAVHLLAGTTFTDLTPAWLSLPWKVFRCESNSLLELRFGRNSVQANFTAFDQSGLHPIW